MQQYYPFLVFLAYAGSLLLFAQRKGRTTIGGRHKIEGFPPRDAVLIGLGGGGTYLFVASALGGGPTWAAAALHVGLILVTAVILMHHSRTRQRNSRHRVGEFYKCLMWILQRPLRLGNIVAAIVLVCAVLFAITGFHDTTTTAAGDSSTVSFSTHGFSAFWRAAYFSIVTFTTVGFGDLTAGANPVSRLVAAMEGLAGLTCFGVLISVLIAKGTSGVVQRWLRLWMMRNRS